MKEIATVAALSLITATSVHGQVLNPENGARAIPSSDVVRTVAPALEKYGQGGLLGDVWMRPDLSPRDRSIVTLAALIARNQTAEMQYHLNLALDNGVKAGEESWFQQRCGLNRKAHRRLHPQGRPGDSVASERTDA